MEERDGIRVNKINVRSDDELTDIIRKIETGQGENILISFSGHSDLLISPVNLRVIQETADEAEKPLIFQIPDSKAGLRNATEIGSIVSTDTKEVEEEMWQMAYNDMMNRRKDHKDALKGSYKPTGNSDQKSISQNEIDLDTEGSKADEDREFIDDEITDYEEEAGDILIEEPKSEFEQTIDNVLARSRQEIQAGKVAVVEEGGLTIAVDDDIKRDPELNKKVATGAAIGAAAIAAGTGASSGASAYGAGIGANSTGSSASVESNYKNSSGGSGNSHIENKNQSLTGKDFANIREGGTPARSHEAKKTFAGYPQFTKIYNSSKRTLAKITPKAFKSKKLYLILGLVVLAASIVVGLYVYYFTPLVRMNIYIESRPVSIEKTFAGDPTVTEFDINAGAIPIRKETVTKERSESTKATGTGTRGEKATGLVRFICGPLGPENSTKLLKAGTTLTTEEGLVYTLVSDVSFSCPTVTFPTGSAIASDFGTEYNISAGVLFDIGGESSVAATSQTSFTGGFKEEFTVVSQGDFDGIVNPAKESAFSEAEDELKAKAIEGWEIVPNSIVNELDGNVVSDKPVGAESDILNVTVKTKSSALYYKRSEIVDVSDELLLQAAEEQNLFESEEDLELRLADDHTTEISVTAIEGDKVTLLVKGSGAVKPSVDKDKIVSDLAGLSWEEGLKYIDSLKFVAKPTEIKFEPQSFPESMRYFPTRQGRILISIKNVEAEPAPAPVEEVPPAP